MTMSLQLFAALKSCFRRSDRSPVTSQDQANCDATRNRPCRPSNTEFIDRNVAFSTANTRPLFDQDRTTIDIGRSAVMSESSPPPSQGELSPDTAAAARPFPDRPIRPLPKRKLRARLSPDVASTIVQPQAPIGTAPLPYYPYSTNSHDDRSHGEQQHQPNQHKTSERSHYAQNRSVDGQYQPNHVDFAPMPPRPVRASPDRAQPYRFVQRGDERPRYIEHEPAISVTSSIDGYESFENTNNKKKRKIPSASDAKSVHLSNEMASLGISHDDRDLDDLDRPAAVVGVDGSYGQHYSSLYASPSPAPLPPNGGLTGPGRGRRIHKPRQQWSVSSTTPGIISTAIADAERAPFTPLRGQENISLLQQASHKSDASLQFTFTCDEITPGTFPSSVVKEGFSRTTSAGLGLNIPGAQNSPVLQSPVPAPPLQPLQSAPALHPTASAPAVPRRTSRRTKADQYALAAQQRMQQQKYQNLRHPPAAQDFYMCEFCEYELIYGEPPRALIRQYEEKDDIARKAEANGKRLLEKAKTKGRKGKKAAVNGKAAASAAGTSTTLAPGQVPHVPKSATLQVNQSAQHAQQVDPGLDYLSQGQSTYSEDYSVDEYDDGNGSYVEETNGIWDSGNGPRFAPDASRVPDRLPLPYDSATDMRTGLAPLARALSDPTPG